MMPSIPTPHESECPSTIEVLEPRDFLTRAQADARAFVLDVRRPEEYASGHLTGAQLLDWMDEELFRQGASWLDKSLTYYVYCRSGKRSHAAAQWMSSQGFEVYDMQGGILHWMELGLPLER